jgi:hypothetical protein
MYNLVEDEKSELDSSHRSKSSGKYVINENENEDFT